MLWLNTIMYVRLIFVYFIQDHGGTMIDNSALSVITPSPSGSSELSVYTNPSPSSSAYATSDTTFTGQWEYMCSYENVIPGLITISPGSENKP